jgi:hypothetical protein
MNADAVLGGVTARGEAVAAAAVPAAAERLAAAVAAALPDVSVTAENAAVMLRAPGLVARAFGTRHRAADPRLAGLVAGGGA